jgi:hypothetical protein
MNLKAAKFWMLALALGCAGAAGAAGNEGQGGIYLKTLPDGSVELNNQPDDEKSERLAIEVPVGAGAGDATAAAAPAATGAAPGQAALPPAIAWHGSVPASEIKDPQLAATLPKIGAAQLSSGNPALGRRYLMVDRATYLKQQGAN